MASTATTFGPYSSGAGSGLSVGTYASAMAWFPSSAGAYAGGVLRGWRSALGVTQRGAGANMSVDVAAGGIQVQGEYGDWSATSNLAIANNSSGSTRIDRIVARIDWANKTTVLDVVQGTPGAGAPSITQDTAHSTKWEISLAQVTVANGAVSITNANITDERGVLVGSAGYYADQYDTLYQAAGDLVYGAANGVRQRLAIGSTGQALTVSGGVPTWTTPSGLTFPYRDIAGSLPRVTVSNTTTETALFSQSVPGSTFSAGNLVLCEFWGDAIQASAATLTLRLKYGGTTLITSTAYSVQATRSAWWFRAIMTIAAASSEYVHALAIGPLSGGNASGSLANITVQDASTTAAENTASTLTLQLTGQLSSGTNADFRLNGAAIQLVN